VYESIELSQHNARSPSPLNAITEIPRTLLEMTSLLASLPSLSRMPRGDNHAVLVLPGFLAGDRSTSMLRQYLAYLGYNALPWGLGRNTGRLDVMQRQLMARLAEIFEAHEGGVSLIGQSLGGVYARELSRFLPARIRQVITLGSPFGVRHAGAANGLVRRLFEGQTGMSVAQMRDAISAQDPSLTPPVPVTAIYSKADGIVNWRVCQEIREDHQTENIEVNGCHCGMGFNAQIYRIIADRLAQPTGNWQRYQG
jgi:pimeloyl-ACP methyl ester carboxylesterase